MRIHNQAAFFGELSAIQPNSKEIVSILSRFSDAGIDFVPTTFQEMAAPEMRPEPRIRLTSETESLDIHIGTKRMDIIQGVPSLGGNGLSDELEQFSEIAGRCCELILHDRGIVGNRLSLIAKDISGELSTDQLESIFAALQNPAGLYAEHPPSEWTVRQNALREIEFGGKHEVCNNIAKIERSQGRYKDNGEEWRDFDRVFVEFDLNTLKEHSNPRFEASDLAEFTRSASVRLLEIKKGFLDLIEENWIE